MIINILIYWLPMIVIAFANATLRELVLVKNFNELLAQQLSTFTLTAFCAIYVWFVYPLLHIQSATQAFLTGLIWVILTVIFEFSLGRLTGKSWEYLFDNYNIFNGHIWLLFLVALFFLPYVVHVIKT